MLLPSLEVSAREATLGVLLPPPSFMKTCTTSFNVRCSVPSNGTYASDTKLRAMKVGQVSSQPDVTGRASRPLPEGIEPF